MIGSRLRQALSPPLALAFTLGLLGGAYGFHGCPSHGNGTHDGPGAAGQLSAGTAGVPVALEAEDDHGGDSGARFCICVGSCHVGAAAAHPGSPAADLPDLAPGPGSVPRVARHVPPYETPAYLLPYALGPPTA